MHLSLKGRLSAQWSAKCSNSCPPIVIQTKFFSNTPKQVTNGDDKFDQCNNGSNSEATTAFISFASNTRLLHSQNVLPLALPFAYAIEKLQVFRGFSECDGVANKTVHHCVSPDFYQILTPENLQNKGACITVCITAPVLRIPARYPLGCPLGVPQRTARPRPKTKPQESVSRRSESR